MNILKSKLLFATLLMLAMLLSVAAFGAAAFADDIPNITMELSDIDWQLGFIQSQAANLKQPDNDVTWFYTVTDLDHDGNLEFVAASQHPQDRSTNLRVWEVSTDRTALTECTISKDPEESFPDILTDVADTYLNAATDTWYYMLYDNVILSNDEVYTVKTAVNLKDGVIDYDAFAVEQTVVVNGLRSVSHTDATGISISPEQYNASGNDALAGTERSSTNFEWLSARELGEIARVGGREPLKVGAAALIARKSIDTGGVILLRRDRDTVCIRVRYASYAVRDKRMLHRIRLIADHAVLETIGALAGVNVGGRQDDVVIKQIVPGVCRRVMEGVSHVCEDVRERFLRILGKRALVQRASICTDLPDLQVGGAVLRVLGRRDKLQISVMVEICDRIIPSVAVILFQICDLSIEKAQLIIDVSGLHRDGLQILCERAHTPADCRGNQHGRREQKNSDSFNSHSIFLSAYVKAVSDRFFSRPAPVPRQMPHGIRPDPRPGSSQPGYGLRCPQRR